MVNLNNSPSTHTGADPGFSFRKRLCASTHIMSAKPNSLSAGVQGPLKGPGSSTLMLSRAIWALFLSILIKTWLKKIHSWSNFRGGRMPVRPPPLGTATDIDHINNKCLSTDWKKKVLNTSLVFSQGLIYEQQMPKRRGRDEARGRGKEERHRERRGWASDRGLRRGWASDRGLKSSACFR